MLYRANKKREEKMCSELRLKNGCSHLTRSKTSRPELKSCTATESCIMDPVQLRARSLTDSVRVYMARG